MIELKDFDNPNKLGLCFPIALAYLWGDTQFIDHQLKMKLQGISFAYAAKYFGFATEVLLAGCEMPKMRDLILHLRGAYSVQLANDNSYLCFALQTFAHGAPHVVMILISRNFICAIDSINGITASLIGSINHAFTQKIFYSKITRVAVEVDVDKSIPKLYDLADFHNKELRDILAVYNDNRIFGA
jgi:hypothetical protein